MLKVIKKDLILNRNVALINLAIMGATLLFLATMDEAFPPRLFAGFGGVMMSALPAILVTREDKFDAMALGCSLPIRRRTIVQGRFVLSVGMAFLGLTVGFLLGAFVPFTAFAPGDLFVWGPILTGLSCMVIVLSFLLPVTLRFGVKGILIFLVGSQVLGVVLLTFVQITGSSADKRIINAIVGFFVRLQDTLGSTGFNIFWILLMGTLLAASYRISVWAFEGREV